MNNKIINALSMQKKLYRSVIKVGLCSLISSTAFGTVLVDLDPSNAVTDVSVPTKVTVAAPSKVAGFTFNLTFTPTANDLTGMTHVMEIGGAANGAGIYLANGVPVIVSKQNSAASVVHDGVPPASDLNISNNTFFATHSFGTLSAGTEYSIATVFNFSDNGTAGNLNDDYFASALFAVSTFGGSISLDTLSITDNHDGTINWSGNNTLSIGSADGLGDEGGLSDSGTNVWNFYNISALEGNLSRALYWNDVGSIAAVPEPASMAFVFGLLGLVIIGVRRRQCSDKME